MPNDEMGSRALPQAPGVHTFAVLIVVGAFLMFVAVSIGAVLLFLNSEAPGAFAPKKENPFPQPVLQKSPRGDLDMLEAAQRVRLSGYDWVDRAHGVARIPIEEAMRMVGARGSRAYDPVETPPNPPGGGRGGSP